MCSNVCLAWRVMLAGPGVMALARRGPAVVPGGEDTGAGAVSGSGTVWVEASRPGGSGRTVIWARVLSPGRRPELDRLGARLTRSAAVNRHEVGEVVAGSGPWGGGSRPRLRRVLSDLAARVEVMGTVTVWRAS